jgi:RimJ/RimL family protein N-acetyltransferase
MLMPEPFDRYLPVARSEDRLDLVAPEHIEAIRIWRNAQMEVLRQQTPLTSSEQEHYFQNHVWPEYQKHHPQQLLVSFFHENQLIGYGGLTHLDWDHHRAEVSFLVSPTRSMVDTVYRRDFLAFFHLLETLAFDRLELHRLFTETFAHRGTHLSLLLEAGFAYEGCLPHHYRLKGTYVDALRHGKNRSR